MRSLKFAIRTLPVTLQELGPGRPLHALRRGFQAMVAKDVGDRASGDVVIEVGQRAPWIRV